MTGAGTSPCLQLTGDCTLDARVGACVRRVCVGTFGLIMGTPGGRPGFRPGVLRCVPASQDGGKEMVPVSSAPNLDGQVVALRETSYAGLLGTAAM